MATAITSVFGTSILKALMFHHDPADATVATKISWQPFKGFEWLMVGVMLDSGTGLLTVKLFAADDSSGTNPVEIKAHSDPTVADAAGDTVWIECSVEQLKEAGAAKTHVSVEVDCDANTDIASVVYIFGGAHRKYAGLTADVIA